MSALRELPTKYVEWQITDFYNIPMNKNYCFESPNFSLFGAVWYLNIFPNGNSEVNTSYGCVGLFLQKRDSAQKYRVSYRLGIKMTDGVEFKYCEDENTFQKNGRGWGWGTSNLLKRFILHKTENVISSDGSLTVFCNIRILNGPFILPAKASQILSSTAETLDPATQTPLPDTILAVESETPSQAATSEAASQTSSLDSEGTSLQFPLDIQLSNTQRPGISSPAATVEAASQTSSAAATVEAASQTSSAAATVEAASQTSSPVTTLETEPYILSTTEQHAKVTSDSDGISTLFEDLKNMYINRSYADVTILVQNKEFSAHRNILVSRSSVFASMFEHEFAEKNSREVEISDCNPDSFEQFLLFLYIGKVDGLTASKAVHLYATADKYDVMELKEECVRCMVRDVSVDSFCDVIHLAVMHSDSELLNAATDFFISNVAAILPTTKWQDFLEDNYLLCNELLIKVMESKK